MLALVVAGEAKPPRSRSLAERNAEVDRIDAVFGYDKIDADSGGAIERVGWCTNMRTVVKAEGEGGAQRAAVEYYFLAPDGTGFKVNQPADAYFYIAVAHGHEAEVDHAFAASSPHRSPTSACAGEDLAMAVTSQVCRRPICSSPSRTRAT